MPRSLTASEEAARIRKWADVGFDFAAVQGLLASLEQDKADSVSRAPRRSGKLASTIRVVRPSSRAAGRKGYIQGALAAGSRGRTGVPYARVLQLGTVYGGGDRSRPHLITKRTGEYRSVQVGVGGGSFGAHAFVTGRLKLSPLYPLQVHHPGSHWPALGYLRVDGARATARINTALQESGNREIG
jgi:hypothetical protein